MTTHGFPARRISLPWLERGGKTERWCPSVVHVGKISIYQKEQSENGRFFSMNCSSLRLELILEDAFVSVTAFSCWSRFVLCSPHTAFRVSLLRLFLFFFVVWIIFCCACVCGCVFVRASMQVRKFIWALSRSLTCWTFKYAKTNLEFLVSKNNIQCSYLDWSWLLSGVI